MTQEEALKVLKSGANVFLTGAPGSGKTFLVNQYIDYLKGYDIPIAVTASTGIAATHMGGTTLHSWSGLGIKDSISDSEIKFLMKRKYLFKRIRSTKVLVIDEVSMLKPGQFDAVDKICQYFKASFLPFGGMQVILSGDFFQLPPIEKSREVNFITDSNAWANMDIKVCYLEGQYRQKDARLSELLDHIRDNNVEAAKKLVTVSQMPGKFEAGLVPTKLYTHNADVDAINEFELSKISAPEKSYEMLAYGPKEMLASLKKSCLAPEKLVLKEGAQVMFIKNNFDQGYVNGTQGRVTGFDAEHMPIIETLDGKTVVARQAGWTVEEEGAVMAEIRQIPVRLAWAITVHKSQGMNLDTAEIDLSKCFIEGMGYVAISRLRSFAGLHLTGINDMAFYVNEKALDMDRQFREDSESLRADIGQLQERKMA